MVNKNKRTMLIKNAEFIVTMNSAREVLEHQSILIENNRIKQIGDIEVGADEIIDAKDCIIFPGFINTHHHLFQSFLRHVPEMQNQMIDKWIALVSGLGKKMDPEAHYYAALVGMAELIFSGCTTTTDMLYFFPEKYDHMAIFEAYIKAANALGIRFHPFRGSMSLGKKVGALFDDDVVESSSEIVERTKKTIEKFHQDSEDAMVRVGIAPCTIFTNTPDDYKQASNLAKVYDVNLQTHLSESTIEQKYSNDQYHKSPLAHLSSLGWDDSRVSFAHCVEINEQDIKMLKKQSNSVCHCPISNARSPIGQGGIAPISEMMETGVNIGIGVDGSAGNDSSNILEEMRWARTISGARKESTYLNPMDVYYMGTMGGAKALRWEKSIGSIEVGKCADLAVFKTTESISHVGAHNVIGSLISCQNIRADTVIINGKLIVLNGKLKSLKEKTVITQAKKKHHKLFNL